MSKLVKAHLPCDDCGSSDALAEYSETTHCFSCGRTRGIHQEGSFFPEMLDVPQEPGIFRLPPGFTTRLSVDAKTWLLTYQIYQDLREKYNIGYVYYGELNHRVILPSYDEGELKNYAARSLSPEDTPKYIVAGDKSAMFWSKGDYKHKTLVIVEDNLSAIRVGEILPAVSLIGTSMSQENMLTVTENYDILIVWLDGDGPGQNAAKKLVDKLLLMHTSVHNVVTGRDPKCLFDTEIRGVLQPFIK